MERRDPQSFMEATLKDVEVDATLQARLIQISSQKPGAKRVAALIDALEQDDDGR